MSGARRALVALSIVLACLALLGARLGHVQAESVASAEAFAGQGRFEEAIASYRRAIRAHHPLSSRTDEALRDLLALGARLEGEDPALARQAYLGAWGGMNAVTPYGLSEHPLAREAERRLAALRGEAPQAAEIAARPIGKLATAAGLGLALFGGFRLARGGDPRQGWLRRAMLDITFFFAGLAIFVAGALHA